MNEPSIEDIENEDDSEAQDARSIWASDPFTRGIAKMARQDANACMRKLIEATQTSSDPLIRELWGKLERARHTQSLFDLAEGKS